MASGDYYYVGEDFLREIVRVMRKVEGMNFRGNIDFVNGPGGISGFVKGPNVRSDESPQDWWWAEITNELSSGDNQWHYAHKQVRLTSTGWEDVTDGITGTTDTRYAVNSAEANNSDSGIQGNGIDLDDPDFPDGFEIQPIRGNPVVQMWGGTDENGDPTYTFTMPNAIQGPCEETP